MNQPRSQLHLRRFILGPFATNCYTVHADTPERPAWIIDAGIDPQPIIHHAREHDLQPQKIILTHAHADHIGGLDEIRDAFPGATTHIHPAEADWLQDPEHNLSAASGVPLQQRPADAHLNDADQLTLHDVTFTVYHTPGHSPGGVTLHAPELAIAFVGDTLFQRSIGRSDFPTSNPEHLERSIRDVLYKLPPDTRVLSGHGEPTTIAEEMEHNPFVRA